MIRNETGEVIEEEDDDLVIDVIKATMNDGLTYVPGSVTSDPDPVNVVTGGPLTPDDKDIKIG